MQKMRANSVDMLNGPLLPNIWVFSLPLMLTNLLQMLFQAADTVVVGRFAGQQALARRLKNRYTPPLPCRSIVACFW